MNANELTAKINEHIKLLSEHVDDARKSDEMILFLKTISRFHQYSFSNALLIVFANPQATRVAGYTAWQKMNRYVRRGEKGIPILAPCFYREQAEDENSKKVLRGFRVVFVFDVSQTDGQELPAPPQWNDPATYVVLHSRLLDFAASHEIKVVVEELPGEIQGKSDGHGVITLAPGAGTGTLIHELAHELLHRDCNLDRQSVELEAESVSFVVLTHFGLNDSTAANYLALWNADSEKIQARMDRIRRAANQIISFFIPETEET